MRGLRLVSSEVIDTISILAVGMMVPSKAHDITIIIGSPSIS